MTYKVFGDIDQSAVDQLENCMKDERAVAGALMADHHLGYSMPIGGVIAYENAISPSGVGYDIACGNKAALTNLDVADLLEPYSSADEQVASLKPIMRQIQKKISFGMGRKNPDPIDHELFDEQVWPDLEKLSPGLKDKARAQLGTVGSGNHYVDILHDEKGRIWVANHFGSRGLGHTIATGFLNLAANKDFSERGKDSEDPTVIPVDTSLGSLYVQAMMLAGDYAYAGRDYVIAQVLEILGAESVQEVHNHHNFAWFENGYWVVRKGATPLTTEPAFIGGSMGDISVIVRGKESEGWEVTEDGPNYVSKGYVWDVGAIDSAPHGAGRVMSRTKAAGKMRKFVVCSNRDCDVKTIVPPGEKINVCVCGNTKLKKIRARDTSTAAIDWDATRADLASRGIVVLGAGADEAPGVYKSLEKVIAAHENIVIEERLHPLGVVMAGPDEYDPFKD